jgi:ribosomal-protein-alanine N-acetyltransferase
MLIINVTPFPVLQTKRCRLRQLQKEDGPELLLIRSSDAAMQYIDKDKMTTLEEAEGLIRQINENEAQNESITWGIQFKERNTLIGYVGYWRIMKEHYRAEIGYMLHPNFWNSGIMSEVLQEVLPFAFDHLKLHSIEANVNP